VTNLRFRPGHDRELLSAGDDGLVCVIDVARCLTGGRAIEDDSGLRLVMNGGESTKSLTFIGEDTAALAVISTTEVLQVWSLIGNRSGTSCGRFADLHAAPSLKVGETDGYIVDVLYDVSSGRAHAVAGAVDGSLALIHFNLETSGPTEPLMIASCGGGHSGMVRALAPLSNGRFATGGEDGKVCIWAAAPIADEPVTGRASAKKKARHC